MTKRTALGTLFWASLISLEVDACYLAYETIGVWTPYFLAWLSRFANYALLGFFCYRQRRGVLLGLLYLGLIYSYIAPLSIRWYYVDREAKQIISWAESEKARTGNYPEDLSGYVFRNPGNKEYIQYFANSYRSNFIFVINYTVSALSANHHYDSGYGWYYQVD
jgi:hypothetical protein